MTKQLIDWATVPRLTATNEGEFLSVYHEYAQVLHTWSKESVRHHVFDVLLSGLRLAPAEQQPWLVYEEGVTVVPEWALCMFRGRTASYDYGARCMSQAILITHHAEDLDYVAHYKLGSSKGLFKAGWTDKPNEVTE